MSKIKTTVCSHCRKESCDGIIYKVSAKGLAKFDYTGNVKRWRGCKNDRWIDKREGTLYYHWVMGHGCEIYADLETVEELDGR